MEIQVKHGVILLDDQDAEIASRCSWYSTARRNTFYARAWDGGYKTGKQVYMHRLLFDVPEGMQVDHINGNGLDNRRCNLRLVTQSQNLANQKKTRGISKYKGVGYQRQNNKWVAQIQKDGVNHYLGGGFKTEEEAAEAYNRKAIELFGEFALLNAI